MTELCTLTFSFECYTAATTLHTEGSCVARFLPQQNIRRPSPAHLLFSFVRFTFVTTIHTEGSCVAHFKLRQDIRQPKPARLLFFYDRDKDDADFRTLTFFFRTLIRSRRYIRRVPASRASYRSRTSDDRALTFFFRTLYVQDNDTYGGYLRCALPTAVHK